MRAAIRSVLQPTVDSVHLYALIIYYIHDEGTGEKRFKKEFGFTRVKGKAVLQQPLRTAEVIVYKREIQYALRNR